jgi:hypothetical protein
MRGEWRTEGAKRCGHSAGVFVCRADEDVEIAGTAHDTMRSESMRAHDQELDAGISQPGDQIDEVLVELGRLSHCLLGSIALACWHARTLARRGPTLPTHRV